MSGQKTLGAMRLREWMIREARRQPWLAEKLDCSQTAISAWLRGESVPSLALAFALENLTGVEARAWSELSNAPDSGTLPTGQAPERTGTE